MKNSLLIPLTCLFVGFIPVATPSLAQSPAPTICSLDNGSGKACGLKVNPAPSKPFISPFLTDTQSTSASILDYRPVEQLNAGDRALLKSSLSRIVALANEQGFDFQGQESEDGQSGWIARQAVCSALPNHLLIHYVQAPGTRSEASFTVALPRDGVGRIHLAPVERRGFTLYTPSRRNRLTVVIFNDLLREDKDTARADWLGLGLCYAALAGDHVEAVTALSPSSQPSTGIPQPTYTTASLSLSWKQPPSITFVGLPPGGATARQWTLIFTPNGSLHKVQTKRAYPLAVSPAREDPRMEAPVIAKGQVVDLK